MGAPHSLIRHPDMPRCVFKLLWDTLEVEAGDLRLCSQHGKGRQSLGVRTRNADLR